MEFKTVELTPKYKESISDDVVGSQAQVLDTVMPTRNPNYGKGKSNCSPFKAE